MTVVAALVVAFMIVVVVRRIVERPQRGMLLLAALLPFDGLLVLVDAPRPLAGWKEALVLVTLTATFLTPPAARAARGRRWPAWTIPFVALLAMAVASGLFVERAALGSGLKIGFFYALVGVTLWQCPFDARDRDRFVGILMATATVTAAVALAQQVVGPDALVGLGYEYNTNVRFAGDRLRSFSTFADPFQYALFSMFALLVTLPVAVADARRRRNALFLAASPVLVLAMSTSVVRASLAGLVVGIAWLVGRRHPRAVAVGAVVVVAAVAALPSAERAVFLSPASLVERVEGWTSTIVDELGERPFGQGVGTTGSAAEAAGAEELRVGAADELAPDDAPYQPDNQYLKMILELGPIGLWLFGAFVVLTFVQAHRLASGGPRADRPLAAGIAAGILGAAIAAVASTYWEVFPCDAFFWLTLGVLTSIDHEWRSTPSPSAPAGPVSRPTSVSSSAR